MTSTPRALVLLAAVILLASRVDAYTVRYTPAATKVLTAEQRAAIDTIAATAETDARRAMSELPRGIVVVVEVGRNVLEQTGERGAAISPTVIRWTVNPDRPEGVMAVANTYFRATLFHESHHVVRGWVSSGAEPPGSFMEAVVAEGLATAFARDAGNARAPWADYAPEVAAWVRELLALPEEQAWSQYSDWMVRHPDGREWIGHRAGTYIADLAIKASGRTAADLALMPTADVLRLAGYF